MENLKHNESVFEKWKPLLTDVKIEAPGVMQTIINQGGTRDAWRYVEENQETFLMAYPAENLVRASVVVQGELEGKLEGMHLIPLLEGIPNQLMVVTSKEWGNKVAADVLLYNPVIEKSFWVHNPLYYRDKKDLQPEQPQTVKLSGLVYAARKALLDEMTVAKGPSYEAHAMKYLAENPDKSRLDVPPLKISLAGQQMIGLGNFACEYQARAVVRNLEEFEFGPEGGMRKIYSFIINLATDEKPMPVILYASETICQDVELKEDMEIDLYFWLQGRVVD